MDPQKTPTSVVAHEAFGGAIRVVEAPRGGDWLYREDMREGEGFTVMVLKFVLPATPTPLILLAKIYTHPPDASPEQTAPDWRSILAPLFSSLATVVAQDARQTTMSGSLPAWEAVLEGVGMRPLEPLRVRERRSTAGRELFVVGAMGSPTLFEAHAHTIDQWFASTAFVPVEDEA